MGVVFEADTFSLVQIAYIKAFQQIKYMDNGISYLIVLLLNTVINIRFFGGMPVLFRFSRCLKLWKIINMRCGNKYTYLTDRKARFKPGKLKKFIPASHF